MVTSGFTESLGNMESSGTMPDYVNYEVLFTTKISDNWVKWGAWAQEFSIIKS